MSPETITHTHESAEPDLDWPTPTREVMRSLERAPVWGPASSSADDERAAA